MIAQIIDMKIIIIVIPHVLKEQIFVYLILKATKNIMGQLKNTPSKAGLSGPFHRSSILAIMDISPYVIVIRYPG